MDTITKCRREARGSDLVVKVEWNNGPRTAAWDRLWRAILSDLAPEAVPTGGQRETVQEGEDG